MRCEPYIPGQTRFAIERMVDCEQRKFEVFNAYRRAKSELPTGHPTVADLSNALASASDALVDARRAFLAIKGHEFLYTQVFDYECLTDVELARRRVADCVGMIERCDARGDKDAADFARAALAKDKLILRRAEERARVRNG